jgi:hypothetical protein
MMGIASIFGLMTCFAQATVLFAQMSGSAQPAQEAETSESKYV